VRIDCAAGAEAPESWTTALAAARADDSGRPQLLLLERLNLLTTVTARSLHESVRDLRLASSAPLVVASVDSPTVDASRPYGLLLGWFQETTHVPALRFRVEEIGEIALTILHRRAAGRSVRLSHQVLRILEGYAWPGNIDELEDVVRYVLTRKPVGEIQPPDLPPVCFQGRSTRLSMLETAQCEAIIQALYESRGNRYKAAAMLGIARSTLYRKIDAFGISYIA
jgi:transcriptional regulator with AAA-type ATPase domain